MKRVAEEEYKQFKTENNIDSSCMKITEEFPDGSYSILYKMGTNRKVNMCCCIHTAMFGNTEIDETCYYIY